MRLHRLRQNPVYLFPLPFDLPEFSGKSCTLQLLPGAAPPPLTCAVTTRWWQAPEMLLHGRYDKSVDIWAAGCILGVPLSAR